MCSLISIFVVPMKQLASLAIQNATSEDSDQTLPMGMLIWIFAGGHGWRYIFCRCDSNYPTWVLLPEIMTGGWKNGFLYLYPILSNYDNPIT